MSLSMTNIAVVLLLFVFVRTSTTQDTSADQCLSICTESWPDTRGPVGPPGPPGTPGISGPVGRQGQPGVIGPVGTQGVKGEPGEKGEKGDVAVNGDKGESGVRGETGHPGKIGPQGPKGESGENGTDGASGGPGVPGVKGQKGETGEVQQAKVAFTVGRHDGLEGTSSEQTITYTDDILNEGANINLGSGVFTCEVPGIYYFSFTFRSNSGKFIDVQLRQNGVAKFKIYRSSYSDYTLQSQSGMLHLNRGDEVKLVLPGGTRYRFLYCGGAPCNTFSGFLIYPD